MRVLGVDPGSHSTGWGLLKGDASRPRLVECGVISLRRADPFPVRLHDLSVKFRSLIQRLEPSDAAVETPFHGVNARAALQLAHARGVLLAALAGANIPVTEYTPAMVKNSVTGNGRAEKAQVKAMVERLLGPDLPPSRGSDIADALAVALCHAYSAGFRDAVACSEARDGRGTRRS